MASIYNPIPNSRFYAPTEYSIDSGSGPLVLGTGLAVTQDGKLLVASGAGGTVTAVIAGEGLGGGAVTTAGTLSLLKATNATLGGIKVGANLLIAPDGTLSALPPGTGTITGVYAGAGLSGGGSSGSVTLSLNSATSTQIGGVAIAVGGGISISGGSIALVQSSQTQIGGVRLATSAEVISGADPAKVVTPATLQTKVASTTARGLVQLSDSVAGPDSTKAATQTAAFTANAAAVSAQNTANAALPKSGGTMTGVITFAPAQTFPGVAFPVATANSLGVISAGPGLSVNSSGVLSTNNNGTVTAITAGPGLGAPASGDIISDFGTLRLLPPTTDGIRLGGVKAGDNIQIDFDGTISVPGSSFIASNNQYAYNSYIWPIPNPPGPGPIPAKLCPGLPGQVLTITDDTTGQLAWTSTGTLSTIQAGPGLTVSSTPTTATISLQTQPSVVPGNYGGQALIPTLAINQYGQVTSTGLANPYTPYQTATVTAPPALVLDFAYNNLNWKWDLIGNITIQDPLNAQSGQSGYLLITQDSSTPYLIGWGSAWKFENSTPYIGNSTLSSKTLIAFTVVAADYIVVTKIIENLG